MTKKVLALILAALMGISTVGCSSDSSSSQTDNSGSGSNSSSQAQESNSSQNSNIGGEIVIWETLAERTLADEAFAERLKDIYPNLTLSYEGYSEDTFYSVLSTAFSSGAGPDVIGNAGTKNPTMPSLYEEGHVADLDGLIDMSIFEPEGEITTVSSDCYIDGKLFAVPVCTIGTRANFYNIDLFEEKGWEMKEEMTLDEFEALCSQIAADGVVPMTIGAADWYTIMHVWDICMGIVDGGPEYLKEMMDLKVYMNDPRCAAGLQMVVDWRNNGWFSASSDANDQAAALLEFASGGSAMWLGGSFVLANLRSANENLNLGQFKLLNEGDGKVYQGVTADGGYSIAKNTDNYDAALAFCQWVATLEGQQTWLDAMGGVPDIEGVVASDPLAADIGKCDATIPDTTEKLSVTGSGESGSEPFSVFEGRIQDAFSGIITVDEYLDLIAEQQDLIEK